MIVKLRLGALWVTSQSMGLHGKVEPRSTPRGNSRVQLLTDVSQKAAGYLGTVPAL